MFSIDYSAPADRTECSCCGATIWRFTRFVSQHGDALAVCFLEITGGPKHPQKADVLLSLGEWWLDRSSKRRCFLIEVRNESDHFECSLQDPEKSRWSPHPASMGRLLVREQGLKDPQLKLVWRILDQLIEKDIELRKYLCAKM